jgi:hypothetical protein
MTKRPVVAETSIGGYSYLRLLFSFWHSVSKR